MLLQIDELNLHLNDAAVGARIGLIPHTTPAGTAGLSEKQLANQSSCCLAAGWVFNF